MTSALSGVVAQRLARKLCMHCKQPYVPTDAEIVAAGWTMDEVAETELSPRCSDRSVARPARRPVIGDVSLSPN